MKQFIVIALLSVSILACTNTKPKDGKFHIVTTTSMITDLVENIGGDKVETTLFVPPGIEPHDFEPTARQMASLKEAKVLFINGLDMEHWAESGSITGSTKVMLISEFSQHAHGTLVAGYHPA